MTCGGIGSVKINIDMENDLRFQAALALLTAQVQRSGADLTDMNRRVKYAVYYADALIAELKK